MGASLGGFGTVMSQNAWLPVFRTLGAQLWSGGRLMVPRAQGAFDADGNLIDPKVSEALRGFLGDFVAFVGSTRNEPP